MNISRQSSWIEIFKKLCDIFFTKLNSEEMSQKIRGSRQSACCTRRDEGFYIYAWHFRRKPVRRFQSREYESIKLHVSPVMVLGKRTPRWGATHPIRHWLSSRYFEIEAVGGFHQRDWP